VTQSETLIAAPVHGIGTKLRTMRLFFLMTGLGISVWAIIVPFTKIRFNLDDGTLGLMLLAGGSGGVVAMPICGIAISRFGSRNVLVFVSVAFGVLLPLLTLAPSPVAFTAMLFLYGAIFGAADVAMNAQAVVIERQSGRREMSLFHALYSIGTLAVAIITSLLLRLGLSNIECALLTGAVILLIATQSRFLLSKDKDLPSGGPLIALPNRATLTLGLCCFACFLTEGASTDWSTIFMRFSRNVPIASATFGYAAFAVTMAASRLLGDRTATWLGPVAVMRLGCGIAAAGLLLVVAVPVSAVDVIGFGLVGLGTGNIAPLVFNAAARVPGMTANHSVPAVVGLGYVGFLIGPVIIGLVAHALSLSVAFGMDAALMVAIGFAGHAVE